MDRGLFLRMLRAPLPTAGAFVHYQHRYHAGNFADVFKHVLLISLLRALNAKPKPWCYVDTHAGSGDYRLDIAEAARTGEFERGIAQLLADPRGAPEAVRDYLELIRTLNPEGPLRRYPGSPQIAQLLARDNDRLWLCENVAAIAAELRDVLHGDARAHIHQRNGYEISSLLPPPEKRALILVDPPFERADEFDACGDFLQASLKRFAHGVYAVWYPYKQRAQTQRWLRRMRAQLRQDSVNLTLSIGRPAEGRMRGCGLLVVNPPYAFMAPAQAAIDDLAVRLKQDDGAFASFETWQVTP